MKKIIIYFFLLFLLPANNSAQEKIIVIDPGHDWDNTTGVLEPVRTELEVITNWEVANNLKDAIENTYSFNGIDWDVVLTREDNSAGSETNLDQRKEIANAQETAHNGKVYFLSIHCNGVSGTSSATGTETFYCNYTYNSNDNLLKKYAQAIHDNMVEYGEWNDRSKNRNPGASITVEEDYTYYNYHLGVLKNLIMPNCLNEIGFVTNSDDAAKLSVPAWRDKFAQAYFEGLREAFSDLSISSVTRLARPCFSYGENHPNCKVSVVVNNPSSTESWFGEIRAKLKYFPWFDYFSPWQDFCQLGLSQNVLLPPGQSMLVFEDDIPQTMEYGMVLELESRNFNTYEGWEKLSCPTHRKTLKVPINSAVIDGFIYNNSPAPLLGSEVWSYEININKSATMAGDPLGPIYDPKSDRSDKDGYFELLIPYDWEEGVVSVRNHSNYDETRIYPIADNTLTLNYTNTPYIVGYGSGCEFPSCTSESNPCEKDGTIFDFENLTINGQTGIAIVCPNEDIVFDVEPKNRIESKDISVYCNDSYQTATQYFIYTKARPNIILDYYARYRISVELLDLNLEPMYKLQTGAIDDGTGVFDNGYGGYYNINEIDLKKILSERTWFDEVYNQVAPPQLTEGNYYRLGLGTDDKWRYVDIYILPDHIYYSGLINNVDLYNYASNTITLEAVELYNGKIKAGNQINIIPGNTSTKIGPSQTEISIKIDKNLVDCSGTIQKKGSLKSGSIEDYEGSDLEQTNMPSRTVSTLRDECICEDDSWPNDDLTLLKVYPNPANKKLEIESKALIIEYIEIYDMEGKLCLSESNSQSSSFMKIEVSSLIEGMYVIRVITPEEIQITKFVKE